MATDTYSTESKEYENSLDTSYKKGKGIYYTDMELSSRIIKFLEIPCGAYILDPVAEREILSYRHGTQAMKMCMVPTSTQTR